MPLLEDTELSDVHWILSKPLRIMVGKVGAPAGIAIFTVPSHVVRGAPAIIGAVAADSDSHDLAFPDESPVYFEALLQLNYGVEPTSLAAAFSSPSVLVAGQMLAEILCITSRLAPGLLLQLMQWIQMRYRELPLRDTSVGGETVAQDMTSLAYMHKSLLKENSLLHVFPCFMAAGCPKARLSCSKVNGGTFNRFVETFLRACDKYIKHSKMDARSRVLMEIIKTGTLQEGSYDCSKDEVHALNEALQLNRQPVRLLERLPEPSDLELPKLFASGLAISRLIRTEVWTIRAQKSDETWLAIPVYRIVLEKMNFFRLLLKDPQGRGDFDTNHRIFTLSPHEGRSDLSVDMADIVLGLLLICYGVPLRKCVWYDARTPTNAMAALLCLAGRWQLDEDLRRMLTSVVCDWLSDYVSLLSDQQCDLEEEISRLAKSGGFRIFEKDIYLYLFSSRENQAITRSQNQLGRLLLMTMNDSGDMNPHAHPCSMPLQQEICPKVDRESSSELSSVGSMVSPKFERQKTPIQQSRRRTRKISSRTRVSPRQRIASRSIMT